MSSDAHDPPEALRPVLYLDLDDTILSWADGSPRPGSGAREFLLWALAHFEVRWLTTWCPDGRMDPGLLEDLSKLTGVPIARLDEIRGFDWEGGSKLDGLAWLEHVAHGRPFLWIEDSSAEPHTSEFLARHGFRHHFHRCDVTRDPDALRRLHRTLMRSAADGGPSRVAERAATHERTGSQMPMRFERG